MPNMTKGHKLVKNRATENPKSHAHLQIMMKYSVQFHVTSIKDDSGVAVTDVTKSASARALSVSKKSETKIQNHMHIVS